MHQHIHLALNNVCRIYDDTISNHPEAQMISSPVQSKFLEFISSLFQPKYILEWEPSPVSVQYVFTKGLQTNGELHTIELREDDANTALEKIFYQPVWAIKYDTTGDAEKL